LQTTKIPDDTPHARMDGATMPDSMTMNHDTMNKDIKSLSKSAGKLPKDRNKAKVLNIDENIELPQEAKRAIMGSRMIRLSLGHSNQNLVKIHSSFTKKDQRRAQVFGLPNQEPPPKIATVLGKLKRKQESRGSFYATKVGEMPKESAPNY